MKVIFYSHRGYFPLIVSHFLIGRGLGKRLFHYTIRRGEHHFRGLTNPENAPIVLLYDTVVLFLVLYQEFSYL